VPSLLYIGPRAPDTSLVLKQDQVEAFQAVLNTYRQHILTVYQKEVPPLQYHGPRGGDLVD
jgi:hypothetical protein